MKKLVITVLSFAIMLSFCACGSNIGEVSHATDPLTYFASDHTWRINEIKSVFGDLEMPEAQNYITFGHTRYSGSNIPAFGESWNLEIFELNGSIPYVLCGCFYFEQNDYSDKEYTKYRDKIVEYYTKIYGKPDYSCESRETPTWDWDAPEMKITLQDCHTYDGMMYLMFKEAY